MPVTGLDHLVLTVHDLERTVTWYRDVAGMRPVTFGGGRRALSFGEQKINLHEAGHEFEPKAATPLPGTADLCFIVDERPDDLARRLQLLGVQIELGPVRRQGAIGALVSVYVRDPDENLVELGWYADDETANG